MGAIAPRARPWTRREAVALALLALGLGLGPGLELRPAAADSAILTVSRKSLLNDTDHARALLKSEIALTARLQSRVDAVKAELAAEEQELTRLRPTMDREAFAARVAAFDRKVRRQRRTAQKQAAVLQSAFRAERLKLLEALGPLLEEVRQAHGASVILNADQVLTSDPALDVTGQVIARFNDTVAAPVIPDLDILSPAEAPAPNPDEEGGPPPR
jgi:Skp family chaperone for outer membrane proteins